MKVAVRATVKDFEGMQQRSDGFAHGTVEEEEKKGGNLMAGRHMALIYDPDTSDRQGKKVKQGTVPGRSAWSGARLPLQPTLLFQRVIPWRPHPQLRPDPPLHWRWGGCIIAAKCSWRRWPEPRNGAA